VIAAPCSPRTKDGRSAMCARAVSQQVALRCAGCAHDLRSSGPLALCWDCADEIPLLAGNIRAVRQEWRQEWELEP
jgi:hypothetical protein